MANVKYSKGKESMKATSIVRVGEKDIRGDLSIYQAIDQIKGIGFGMAHAITEVLNTKYGIKPSEKIGSISEEQMNILENVIKNPLEYGIPAYMLNRRKDMETNKDLHKIGNDLVYAVRQDINNDILLKTWRGFRHQYNQKVRGQHTRSTGRTGATIGVMKKSAKAAMKPAADNKNAADKKAAAPAKGKK
ncbi:MAG: 30S ribosomal protein S13 [Candidatus Micrarchaeia archaeon]